MVLRTNKISLIALMLLLCIGPSNAFGDYDMEHTVNCSSIDNSWTLE
jgi:hypothetical protein